MPAKATIHPAWVRDHEIIGPVHLSLQASRFAYSTPREDLTSLDEYSAVEVAIIRDGAFILPSAVLDTDAFNHWWEHDDIAGYVPLPVAYQLRDALRSALL